MIFGCEKCRSYLEQKEFELQCDYLALWWFLKRVKDVGLLGWWILRLAPFNFRVKHSRGMENFVADALSRKFKGTAVEIPEASCAALWQSLLLIYSSLGQHQQEDP